MKFIVIIALGALLSLSICACLVPFVELERGNKEKQEIAGEQRQVDNQETEIEQQEREVEQQLQQLKKQQQ